MLIFSIAIRITISPRGAALLLYVCFTCRGFSEHRSYAVQAFDRFSASYRLRRPAKSLARPDSPRALTVAKMERRTRSSSISS
jgi:hypothetical protein